MWNMKDRLQYHSNRHGLSVDYIGDIKNLIKKVDEADSVSALFGYEANAKKSYYNLFSEVPEDFDFSKRDYNPPSNEINALISYGNSLLYSCILSKVRQTPLDPSISFVHEPLERRNSLCLDIADIFKPIFVDRLIIRLLNKNMLNSSHFNDNLNGCVLKENGRKKFVKKFEEI